MSDQKKFKEYLGLYSALRRAKINHPGTTATLLLECFVCNDGQLRAGLVVERGLCEEGKFSLWRKNLIEKGWIVYVDGDYSTHKPGAKLVKYINKEKIAKEELATKNELRKVEERIDARVLILENSVRTLIEKYDPPVTVKKLSAYIPTNRADLENFPEFTPELN